MTWTPNTNSHRLLLEAQKVLGEYTYEITPKQLFYLLVSKKILENKISNFRKLSNLLLNARKHGFLQTDLFIEKQSEIKSHEFLSPAQYLQEAAETYRVNRMSLQDDYLEIWVEHPALARFMEGFLGEYDIPVFHFQGYSSYGFTFNAHLRMIEALRSGKLPRVLYFSDFGSKSYDIYRAATKELAELFSCSVRELSSVVFRAGVLPEHLAAFDLPVGSSEGPNSKQFSEEYGSCLELLGLPENSHVELEAIEPGDFQTLTLNVIFSILKQSRYSEALELEAANIERLQYLKDSIFSPET